MSKVGWKKPEGATPALPKTVKCRYSRSNSYRVVPADGIFGGITPQGQIQVGFFSERFPMPSETDLHINPNGTVGDEVKGSRLIRPGIERELEFTATLRPDTAHALLKWLKGHLDKLDAFHANKQKAEEQKK